MTKPARTAKAKAKTGAAAAKAGTATRDAGTPPAPATPLAPGSLRMLPLPPPPEPLVSPGALALFRDRLFLAGRRGIVAAAPGGHDWDVAHESGSERLTQDGAFAAERLGLVEDGLAAAAMKTELPASFALGPFAVFKGKGDRAPCLYCGTASVTGGRVLRSADGQGFEAAGAPGLGDPGNLSFGALAAAGRWLVAGRAAIPAPKRTKGTITEEDEVRLYASAAPVAGDWAEAAAPGFGAGVAGGITALAEAHGHVYAAVEGAYPGFQLWRAKIAAKLPWAWEKVIDRGGQRFSHAPAVTAMTGFGGALYLAAGISESGYGKDRAGPAAAEILRVDAGGGWDLIMGQPRFTPQGLKVPLSGIGPGFGDGFTTVITGFVEHGGVLYAGTRNAEGEYRMRAAEADPAAAPPPRRGPGAGGCALWASADGEEWAPVMTGGGGNPAAIAVRALCAGPGGLYAAIATSPALLAFQSGMSAAGIVAEEETEIWHAG